MPSLGQKLREAREARGLEIDEIARETRIRADLLASLEAGRFRDLPGGAFNRGFVRSYALALGLDPDPLVRLYEEEEETQTQDGRLPARPDVLDEMREKVAGGSGGPIVMFMRRHAGTIALVGGLAVVTGLALAAWRIVPTLKAANVTGAGPIAEVELPARGGEAGLAQSTSAGAAAASAEEPAGDETPVSGAPAETASAAGAKTAAPSAKTPAARASEPADEPPPAEKPATKIVVTRPAAPEPAEPPAPKKPAPAKPAAPSLSVAEAALGVDVVNRELVGQSDRFDAGTSVYFWTRVVGGEPGDEIRHVWMQDGRAKGLVELPVNASHWRTYSRFPLRADASGTWTVEARDERGNVLARKEFVVN